MATADELRDILCVARKLRNSAREEADEDYALLYERAANALEERARALAFNPFETPVHRTVEEVEHDAELHRPIDLRC